MTDKFAKDKLKKENIALWRRYLTQEGLIRDENDDLGFEAMLDQGVIPSSGQNDIGNSVDITQETSVARKPNVISNEIDKRTDQKLRQGKIKIDARLDLHGYNRYDARAQCIDFITKSYQKGVRTALIITGKGRPSVDTAHIIPPEEGVLKQLLPEWLNEQVIRPKILKFYPAQKKDGGTGAFYVYLRKKK